MAEQVNGMKIANLPGNTTMNDTDVMIVETAAPKTGKITFLNICNAIVAKLSSLTVSALETTDKTLVGAINELNSTTQELTSTSQEYGSKQGTNCYVHYNQHTVTLFLNISNVNITGGNTNNTLDFTLPKDVTIKNELYVPCVVLSSAWVPATYGYLEISNKRIRTVNNVTSGVVIASYTFPRGDFVIS